MVFDAKLTATGIKHYEKTYLSAAPRNAPILAALDRIRDILISVATGGPRIQQVDAEYRTLFGELSDQLAAQGIENPVPFSDLWQWYGRWSSGDLPSYQSRRQFIAELIDPLAARLRSGRAPTVISPTGWSLVDQQIGIARKKLEAAKTEVEYQSVGLVCRGALLSLAKEVFVAARHPILDGKTVGPSDFKRMIEAYIAVELAGGAVEELRKHARSALDLANHTTHKRTAVFRDAAISLEATASVVNIIAIVSGDAIHDQRALWLPLEKGRRLSVWLLFERIPFRPGLNIFDMRIPERGKRLDILTQQPCGLEIVEMIELGDGEQPARSFPQDGAVYRSRGAANALMAARKLVEREAVLTVQQSTARMLVGGVSNELVAELSNVLPCAFSQHGLYFFEDVISDDITPRPPITRDSRQLVEPFVDHLRN